jgi:Holliday junction resolvase RusA-like endonuclease
MKQTLVIPNWHPVSVNKLINSHHMVAHKLKKNDLSIVWTHAIKQGISMATGKRILDLVITLGKGQRALDPDNYYKSLNDALKLSGLIIDDNRQHLEIGSILFNRAERKQTTIILMDIE